MSSISGFDLATKPSVRHVISDFDGTITNLDVDWPALRNRFSVSSIEEVLNNHSPEKWDVIRHAEVDAAHKSTPVYPTLDILNNCENYVILTNNDADAAGVFLDNFRTEIKFPLAIIDRNVLGGSKKQFKLFNEAVLGCLLTFEISDFSTVTYVGDATYELEYAKNIGLDTLRVSANGEISAFEMGAREID